MPYITSERRRGLVGPLDEWVELMRHHRFGEEALDPEDGSHCADLSVERDLLYILTVGDQKFMANDDLESLTAQYREQLGDADANFPIIDVVAELKARKERNEALGGDINFCLCRYLVGLTKIHESPRYETKIQWIQERLEGVRLRITDGAGSGLDVSDVCSLLSIVAEGTRISGQRTYRLGILSCVGQELYARYARAYEDAQCEANGDIMD
jgi:hypothetical protein